ncbi:hypothetical protein POVWA2_077910 [Plasmodium ovale wallikeri]|uniref:PIR Superfamily Protein n=1 Tax=Plasmodium ovale wallikeri TaxID=864142 RepID=A0A1A9ANS9_PLAOA|nr:hypothetical protein POVWA2_077910 [Plasmodium ovale wallikeri]SBT57748.1 hypothetical protein POVWA1_083540 [Plasmodium ovale wallikeri]
MENPDVNNCNLSSDKYYENLESVTEEESSKSYCNSNNNILDNYLNLKAFCCKLVSHLVNLKNRNSTEDMKKHFWLNIVENLDVSIKNKCNITFSSVSIGYLGKWKKMHDYNNNYVHLKTEFDNKKNCKENYYFKNCYKASSELEQQCKDVYQNVGFYKVNISFEDQDEGTYIEQYVSEHKFSFIERLLGISIGIIIYKFLHFSKFVIAPILLILFFYFFMKKLSLFGSKITPRVDNLRKMWRNVQCVTNTATLLNPAKPPTGGNKMGLPYKPI